MPVQQLEELRYGDFGAIQCKQGLIVSGFKQHWSNSQKVKTNFRFRIIRSQTSEDLHSSRAAPVPFITLNNIQGFLRQHPQFFEQQQPCQSQSDGVAMLKPESEIKSTRRCKCCGLMDILRLWSERLVTNWAVEYDELTKKMSRWERSGM